MEQKCSWVVAFACCFINCLLYGIIRLSGLMLVEMVIAFEVSRAKAAVPFSVSTSIRSLCGIYVGYFEKKFGLRAVVTVGFLLASLGSGLCFFMDDMFWITFLWGGVFGIGCGFSTCLLPHAINQHFSKHRGIASGISYSGSYIGSFLFPPLVILLIDIYTLQGAFLIISAIILNGMASVMLLRPPKTQTFIDVDIEIDKKEVHTTTKKYKKIIQNFLHFMKINKSENFRRRISSNVSPVSLLSFSFYESNEEVQKFRNNNFIDPIEIELFGNHKHLKHITEDFNYDSAIPISKRKSKFSYRKIVRKKFYPDHSHFILKDIPIQTVSLTSFKNISKISSSYEKDKGEAINIPTSVKLTNISKIDCSNFQARMPGSFCKSVILQNPNILLQKKKEYENYFLTYSSENQKKQINYDNKICGSPKVKTNKSSVNKLPQKKAYTIVKNTNNCCFGWFRMFTNLMFVVIATTMAFHTFVVVCMITIIEDFARDLNVPHDRVHHVLMVLSTFNLVGALTLGMITDKGLIPQCYFIIICFIGTGAAIISITFSNGMTMLLVLVAIYGTFESGVIITLPQLTAQYIEEKKQAVAVASSNVLSCPAVLLVPVLIERDFFPTYEVWQKSNETGNIASDLETLRCCL